MTMAEVASIPLGLAIAAFGSALPYSDTPQGGAGLISFWESDVEDYHKGKAMVILGGLSSVGQFSEPNWPPRLQFHAIFPHVLAIQIAKQLGLSESATITTASLHNADYLKGLLGFMLSSSFPPAELVQTSADGSLS
jgi:hypothetical protein